MPSLTGILGILLAISLAALAGSGMLLKTAWQDVAEANQLYVAQQNETKKAIAEINAVRFEHMQQINSMQINLKEQNRMIVDLRKQSNAIRETSSSLQKSLAKKPHRTGRVASYLLARGMREICRSGGGTKTDCKIVLPKSPKTKPGSATKN